MNCKYYISGTGKCLNPNTGDDKYFCVHHAGLYDNVRTEDFSEEVYFAPWIGVDYEKRHFFGKRTLVLGNSHYCSEKEVDCEERKELGSCPRIRYQDCCYNTIQAMVLRFNFVQRCALCVVGGLTEEEIQQKEKVNFARDSICFYNFVQESLWNGSASPSTLQCKKSDNAFFEVLEKLRPELVIALGTSHMYKDLPGDASRYPERWKENEPFRFEDTDISNGHYILNDSTEIPLLFICHPAARESYDSLFWNKAIAAFAEKNE